MAPRDPRLRPYRAAAWTVYFVIVLLGFSLVVVSVVRSLRGPSRPVRGIGPLPTRAALRVCLTDLELLYKEQNERAWALGSEFGGRDPIARWKAWASDWERRVDELSDRCRLDGAAGEDAAARNDLAGARDALLALHRAYGAQVNRFGDEQGELAEAAAEAIAHAREEVQRTH